MNSSQNPFHDPSDHAANEATKDSLNDDALAPVPEPTPLTHGSGHRRLERVLNRVDLQQATGVDGDALVLTGLEYDLCAITTLENHEQARLLHAESIACNLALRTLLPMLNVTELRHLCTLHAVQLPTGHVRAALLDRLGTHVCNEQCKRSITLIRKIHEPKGMAHLVDILTDTFLPECRHLSTQHVEAFVQPAVSGLSKNGFKVVKVLLDPPDYDGRSPQARWESKDVIRVYNPPVHFMIDHLSVKGLQALAFKHNVKIIDRTPKKRSQDLVRSHQCDAQCPSLAFDISPLSKRAVTTDLKHSFMSDSSVLEYVWPEYSPKIRDTYPPRPSTMRDIGSVMRAYCNALTPEAVQEGPCAVCGQLVKTSEAVPLSEIKEHFNILIEEDATRLERQSISSPPTSIPGPVLLPNVSEVCRSCRDSVVRGVRPRQTLANFLWVGEVPDVLQDLTLAEQTLISRVRFNRCVVRVSNGHAKMVANVIAFEHPTAKIYQKLPMGKDELDDILGVFFTGMAPPSDDDLKRTPVIVRRENVRQALEWLKLNHKDYRDLEIDYQTLLSYPLRDVPVHVVYVKTTLEQGNIIDSARSQFDNDGERGTAEGPCSFSVHGLTADRFTTLSTAERKTAALQHLRNGGGFLAVGHAENPESMYNNPSLYPQMFPHLFPYGYGGLGQPQHSMLISKENHLRWLMMYHDKRFQKDASFVIVAFNHQTIKQSTSGSFMMIKRKNFVKIAEGIRTINPAVLASIAERMKEGIRVTPQNPAEKACFSLLDQIEYIGGHVHGSITSKKRQRNELWSLISFTGTPQWFLTFSPCDNKHPFCLYLAGCDIEFRPEIKSATIRELLATRNPVACARFFHFMVKLFLKHICGWGDEEVHHGVFGRPSSYYGTVEQQGRMTLHLHLLLWIEGAPSPQIIRDRILSGDIDFEEALIAYLESCQVGEFQTGTMDEIRQKVPTLPARRNQGIHELFDPDDDNDDDAIEPGEGYVDPTLTLPKPPPAQFCEDATECECDDCASLTEWYAEFQQTFDDIVYRSNVHKCFGRKDNKSGKSSGANDATKNVPKQHATGKGCINKLGECTARFPRATYEKTVVDRKTGHLNLRKREPWINNVNPTVSYANRCNTDATSLQSGTAINGTVGYISDYVTKIDVKTHQVFSATYNVFQRNPEVEEDPAGLNRARKMILRVVNSLSAKMEFGAPMAALYLLQNPDHYTSHEFQPFYWKNFVNFVENQWETLHANARPQDDIQCPKQYSSEAVGIEVVNNHSEGPNAENDSTGDENVQMGRSGNNFISKASTDDFRYRPLQHESVNLYEWIQCSQRHYQASSKNPRQDLYWFSYLPEHPMAETHAVACDPERRYYVVPNFLGPSLPRRDKGDREFYCMTMLTLFMPWRTGLDLKASASTWDEAFQQANFTDRQLELMANFNLRYECYDARDDFSSLKRTVSTEGAEAHDTGNEENEGLFVTEGLVNDADENNEEINIKGGPDYQAMLRANQQAVAVLNAAGWKENALLPSRGSTWLRSTLNLPRVAIDDSLNATAWRQIIKFEKGKRFREKYAAFPSTDFAYTQGSDVHVRNDAYEVPASYLTKDFVPTNPDWATVMDEIIHSFSLNEGQQRAFRIVSNHATCVAPEQLLMHLGGMGGTGKSRVIKALVAFFDRRQEPYRFVILAPTGTAAALVGGSTYHSFLGFQTGQGGLSDGLNSLSDVTERLKGVGYLLMDEISMISAMNNCRISARCCEALGVYDKPFGGLNVIYAGDFAQLPPVRGLPLYSKAISLHQAPRQDNSDQQKTIGRLIWLQFTTVVILTENMRQKENTPDEVAFRQALINLRYRACTDADVALINSRMVGASAGLTLDDDCWKDVAIITAKNREKDQYNAVNSASFANGTGQKLHSFYSIDCMSGSKPERKKSDKRVFMTCSYLSREDHEYLWRQPPHTSKQIPSCLQICLGMPVLIRYNEATELCMTRGQEARIVGWIAGRIPDFQEKQCLEVLFVELVKPPQQV